MATIRVARACGHQERVEVSNGPAAEKARRAFQAQLELCASCASRRGNCPRCGERLTDPCDPTFCEACFQDYQRDWDDDYYAYANMGGALLDLYRGW